MRVFRQIKSRDYQIYIALDEAQKKSLKIEHFWINKDLEICIVVSFEETSMSLSSLGPEDATFTQVYFRILGTHDIILPNQEILAVTHDRDDIVYFLTGQKQ